MIQYMYKYMPKYYIAHITLIHTHTNSSGKNNRQWKIMEKLWNDPEQQTHRTLLWNKDQIFILWNKGSTESKLCFISDIVSTPHNLKAILSTYEMIKLDIEVLTLFCKLTQDGAPSSELTSKLHHWGTLLYISFVMFKVWFLICLFFIEK